MTKQLKFTTDQKILSSALSKYQSQIGNDIKDESGEYYYSAYSIDFADIVDENSIKTNISSALEFYLKQEDDFISVYLDFKIENHSLNRNFNQSTYNQKSIQLDNFARTKKSPAFLTINDFDWKSLKLKLEEFQNFEVRINDENANMFGDRTKGDDKYYLSFDLQERIYEHIVYQIDEYLTYHQRILFNCIEEEIGEQGGGDE